ncbi:dihydrolipoamide dehydrogenase [Nonlabens sp. MB-3u-79]|uniref:DUF2911 domain-containing protein n=1 Tax=Nonlabens sp. MB-3u-79 TaxID=2058134 RepID=UPI000C300CCD|nr:DUF2911 domain-containing protein [Nonlabens sp. MB-3u-79]AUC79617.1 dihydrolipoamide dehydrogenase [Nonlabens sp. MB-3u-79]|tara:strand:+ start:319 stop:1164 length:846 start_codon:yes stop_codon:yes gene_type:complete
MKKLIIVLSLMFVATSVAAQIDAPQPSPSAKAMQTVGLTEVTLEYSRPAKRGRAIFGELVPFDKLWRTGANSNSMITFSDDVKFAGTDVKAGTYAVYTKPGKNEWIVMLYNDTSNWGNPRTWDENKVVASAKVETKKLKNEVESWTMAINEVTMEGAHLQMMWEETLVAVPFTVPTAAKTQASIDKVMAGPSADDYYSAATFYLDANKNLQQAHEWISEAVEARPEAYWMHRKKSLIEAKMGNKSAAIASAKISLTLAEEAKNMDYVKLNTDSLKEWGAKM